VMPRPLATAYQVSDAVERVRVCREAVERAPNDAVAHLALASALRENRDLAARNSLERAAALAPEWEAVHYEAGKLWLVLDDMEAAASAFARAGDASHQEFMKRLGSEIVKSE
jgi:Flp pilus assembly protein TadD